MTGTDLFLGVDGGGTQCRARLEDEAGRLLGQGAAGPANLRLGLEIAFAAVLDAAGKCLAEAQLAGAVLSRTVACLALAGASEPDELGAARPRRLPFRRTIITTDAHAACVGAHRGRDGGVIVAGTGSVGWAVIENRRHRVGGWGLPLSDEGSGAWLGVEALRRVLRAYDGRTGWTPLLRRLFGEFGGDPHAIVRWAANARPAEFGQLAPRIIEHAAHRDPAAVELIQLAAQYIDTLAARLVALGSERIALVGGLASAIEEWLAPATRRRLVPPEGDALAGALQLARAAALATEA